MPLPITVILLFRDPPLCPHKDVICMQFQCEADLLNDGEKMAMVFPEIYANVM